MKTVSILTSYGGQLFDPEKPCQGYGTELAILETFSRLGADKEYNISIYISKPKGYQVNYNNINWRSNDDWEEDSNNNPPNIVIALRYLNTFLYYNIPRESKIIYYLHDPYYLPQFQGLMLPESLGKNVDPIIDQYVTVGYYQALERLQQWGLNMNKLTVIKNGITLEKDFDPMTTNRKPLSFVYCSCPTRGLWTLLEKWNKIKGYFPSATLTIYYTKTDETIQKFKPYENDKSINYVGKVDQKTLFTALKTTDYWLYWCNNFESCCTLAFEMAYYGPIAICNQTGGLKENVKEGLITCPPYAEEFWDHAIQFIQKLENDPGEKMRVRRAQFEYSKTQTWDHRIPQWIRLFEKL